jgi:hypothetical protein
MPEDKIRYSLSDPSLLFVVLFSLLSLYIHIKKRMMKSLMRVIDGYFVLALYGFGLSS